MESDHFFSPARPSSSGGAVEPARQRSSAASAHSASGERFELRDRVADVVHRADSFSEMAAKAEELGSTLFVAVAADGRRTSIQKVDGQWQRGPQRPASTAMPVERTGPVGPSPTRREVPETPAVPATTAAPKVEVMTELGDAGARPRKEAKAERALFVAGLEAALAERYIIRPAPASIGDLTIGRTEYRFRGDSSRVAFTETNLRLATDTNSPSVSRSMVDVAQARGWRALRVSGHEDFKRQIWLEASVRGLKALGHEPSAQDLALLQREREARRVNRVEPAADAAHHTAAATGENASARGSGSRKTMLATIEAVLVAQRVPEAKRVAIMAAATERLAQLSSQGLVPRVKDYDNAAPSRAVATPAPEIQRTPEQSGPGWER